MNTCDEFALLIVALVKYHDHDLQNANSRAPFSSLDVFLNALSEDITARVRQGSFHQKPYVRLVLRVMEDVLLHSSGQEWQQRVLGSVASFLNRCKPQNLPEFVFGWFHILSHRTFMSKILSSTDPHYLPTRFRDLLMECFRFLDPFLSTSEINDSIALLFKGILRTLLVLLHDFPNFLCENHFVFCQNIPISCIQMRNLVLSAFPKDIVLPDAFDPNLKMDQIPKIHLEPKIAQDYLMCLEAVPALQEIIDYCLSLETTDTWQEMCLELAALFVSSPNQMSNVKNSCKEGFVIQYELDLVGAMVLYLCQQTAQLSPRLLQRRYLFVQTILLSLDAEGRYHLLNSLCNNLRFPNSHSLFCSECVLFLFWNCEEQYKEEILRVLLERLVVHRPHPWGLLVTFMQLIQHPKYQFLPFVDMNACDPEIVEPETGVTLFFVFDV
ncbi:hypothetical protein RFI_14160 [Reticulomyxa filosa]|uniref:CCR4-Not complex component Not1 C-terminal domain-containing protein n=1 Tax=Reticulomyxa filosa TaxID=46433 RepID=X6N9Q7_RETFI|nr:hypothetical protein RFI_14160 [Reticulomyxa filosa]|eukprot:ETO23025.1 hypothetical protein RFI_14160 [Reticulomyxa filosa]